MALVQRLTPLPDKTQTKLLSNEDPQQSLATDFREPEIDTISKVALNINLEARYMISSPYIDHVNQLELNDLELNFKLFAFALSIARPIRVDYATAPYLEIFNWSEVLLLLRALSQRAHFQWTSSTFYVVIFRSQLNKDIDRNRLGLLDQKSHEEACASGGLLKYWFGTPNAERRNLATCTSCNPDAATSYRNDLLTSRKGLWRSHEDAVAGGGGPWHKQARLAAREMYHSIEFHVHSLVIDENFQARLEDYR